MKRFSIVFLMTIIVLGGLATKIQKPERVGLVQTPGEFEQKELTLKAGKPYVFAVENEGVDHKIGFVIAPKGKTDQPNHVKEAYLKNTIDDGEVGLSGTVTLEEGEYVYFCPLNPTPQYTIKVEK